MGEGTMHLDITRTDFTYQYPPFNLMQVKEVDVFERRRPLHVYVHIPYCRSKCRYCYYKTWGVGEDANEEIEAYLDLLSREIQMVSRDPEVRTTRVKSLYIGGGTPSLLSLDQLKRLFWLLMQSFAFEDGFEFCMEANPDESVLTPEKLQFIKEAGVTRLSMGVQTLDNDILRLNGRAGSADQFLRVYSAAKSLGFKVINLDFMSGLLGENWKNWTQQLDTILALHPENVSIYKLEFYLNTRLTTTIRESRSAPGLLSDDDEAQFAQYAFDRLQDEGGYHANNCFSLSRSNDVAHVHTAGVWNGESLLGLGLSAYGVFDNQMYQNMPELKDYAQSIQNGQRPIRRAHRVSERERIARTMVYGIKTLAISRARFFDRHGVDMMLLYGDIIRGLVATGNLDDDGDTLRVSRSKYIYADDICRHFFLPEHETMMRGHLTRERVRSLVASNGREDGVRHAV
jgi:oxygen-independent coproporphyrinogen-3 oxidase